MTIDNKKYVLIVGYPGDQLKFYGPFKYISSAEEFFEDYLDEDIPSSIQPITCPLEFLDENDPAQD